MTYALEKRGYVKAGPWTPECNVEHPDGGQFFFLIGGLLVLLSSLIISA